MERQYEKTFGETSLSNLVGSEREKKKYLPLHKQEIAIKVAIVIAMLIFILMLGSVFVTQL